MTPTLSCVLTPVLFLFCFFVCLFIVCFCCCLFFRNQSSNEHQHSAWNPHCFILVASLKKEKGKLAKPATLLGPAILPLQVHSLGCLHIWPIATVPDGGYGTEGMFFCCRDSSGMVQWSYCGPAMPSACVKQRPHLICNVSVKEQQNELWVAYTNDPNSESLNVI